MVGVSVAFGGGKKPDAHFTFNLKPLPQDALDQRLEQHEQDAAFKQEKP